MWSMTQGSVSSSYSREKKMSLYINGAVNNRNFNTIMMLFVSACMLILFNCAWLFDTLWTVTWQYPLSLGLSRQEYWSGLPCSSEGDLPNPEIKAAFPVSPALQAVSLPLSQWGSPMILWKWKWSRSVVSNCLWPYGL